MRLRLRSLLKWQMSFSGNCQLLEAEIWRTVLRKRRFRIMSGKVVAQSLQWRQLEVEHLLVVGEVMSVYSFMPLFLELWSAEGQIVSSLCTISTECIWEREVSELPMHWFLQGLSSSWEPSRPRRLCGGCGAALQSMRASGLGSFFELLIGKDLQTGLGNVLHCVTVGVIWGSKIAEGVTRKFWGFVSSPGCSRSALESPLTGCLGKLESSVWGHSKTTEDDLEDR